MGRSVFRVIVAAGLFVPLWLQSGAYAQDPVVKGDSAPVIEGDIEYGQYLASECVTCHSAKGKDKGIPPITGWDIEQFKFIIRAYKSKELENPVMRMIAGRLDDKQIASLALYFASLPNTQ